MSEASSVRTLRRSASSTIRPSTLPLAASGSRATSPPAVYPRPVIGPRTSTPRRVEGDPMETASGVGTGMDVDSTVGSVLGKRKAESSTYGFGRMDLSMDAEEMANLPRKKRLIEGLVNPVDPVKGTFQPHKEDDINALVGSWGTSTLQKIKKVYKRLELAGHRLEGIHSCERCQTIENKLNLDSKASPHVRFRPDFGCTFWFKSKDSMDDPVSINCAECFILGKDCTFKFAKQLVQDGRGKDFDKKSMPRLAIEREARSKMRAAETSIMLFNQQSPPNGSEDVHSGDDVEVGISRREHGYRGRGNARHSIQDEDRFSGRPTDSASAMDDSVSALEQGLGSGMNTEESGNRSDEDEVSSQPTATPSYHGRRPRRARAAVVTEGRGGKSRGSDEGDREVTRVVGRDAADGHRREHEVAGVVYEAGLSSRPQGDLRARERGVPDPDLEADNQIGENTAAESLMSLGNLLTRSSSIPRIPSGSRTILAEAGGRSMERSSPSSEVSGTGRGGFMPSKSATVRPFGDARSAVRASGTFRSGPDPMPSGSGSRSGMAIGSVGEHRLDDLAAPHPQGETSMRSASPLHDPTGEMTPAGRSGAENIDLGELRKSAWQSLYGLIHTVSHPLETFGDPHPAFQDLIPDMKRQRLEIELLFVPCQFGRPTRATAQDLTHHAANIRRLDGDLDAVLRQRTDDPSMRMALYAIKGWLGSLRGVLVELGSKLSDLA